MESVPVKKKKKKKVKVGWIVFGGIVLVIVGLLIVPRLFMQKNVIPVIDFDATTVLEYTDLENTIAANGTVESADKTCVYSTLNYTVKDVPVEVGDVVKTGDVLAQLDIENIEDQIRLQQINIKNAQANSSVQVKNAQSNLDNFKSGLSGGLNTNLQQAQAGVDNAYDAYIKAQNNYDRLVEGLQLGQNSALLQAQNQLRNAEIQMQNAQDAVSSAQSAYQQAIASGDPAAIEKAASALTTAQRGVDTANSGYATARAGYDAAFSSTNDSVADAQMAVDTAYRAYQNALAAQEAAQKAVNEQLTSYESGVTSAKIGASTEASKEQLRQLEADLENATITAPCDGTVTAVYASVGSSGAGLLFVIEDVDDLIISTSVKGYDVGTVKTGMKTRITTDSLKGEEFGGTITKIAPTSNKTAAGTTDTSSEPVFAAEVAVTDKNTGLLIGMDAQLDYIIDSAKHVLTVPYDAVYLNDAGETCILVLDEAEENYTVREVPVTVGTENDIDIAVAGEGIADGMRVINEPDRYKNMLGQTVRLDTVNAASGMLALAENMGDMHNGAMGAMTGRRGG